MGSSSCAPAFYPDAALSGQPGGGSNNDRFCSAVKGGLEVRGESRVVVAHSSFFRRYLTRNDCLKPHHDAGGQNNRSTPSSGIEPWDPLPCTVTLTEKAEDNTGSRRVPTYPPGKLASTCWPRYTSGCGIACLRGAASIACTFSGFLSGLENPDESSGPFIFALVVLSLIHI